MGSKSVNGVNIETVENGNVILVEPNSLNINTKDITSGEGVVNGIPQYQDMYIFAELTAESKGRTVITTSGNASTTQSDPINFLGPDQNEENNPNYLNFTTNYYDGSTGNRTHYEGFGITNIKIVINSSFIPQVDIQFVDIRGLAFFNQTDSQYRMLFDFPPPIFTLTVKGYYGNSITYQLHLVKYTSEFSAENGNFIIDAQFVAVTFAPLADILFRYVINAPLINNNKSMGPSTGVRPINTFNLIMKLKNLYAAISEKLETSTENKQYDSVQTQIETIGEIFTMLQAVIYNENEVLQKPGPKPYLIVKSPQAPQEPNPATNTSQKYSLQIIRNLSEYNEVIKAEETTGIKDTLVNRLYIAYVRGDNLPLTNYDYDPNPQFSVDPIFSPYAFPETKNYETFKTPLDDFKKTLMENKLPAFNIKDSDVATPAPFTNGVNITNNNIAKTEYYGMDVTEYYYKLYKKNQALSKEQNELSKILADKINNMVSQNLGMTPSIYNIFEVILNDVDEFFRILTKTARDADEAHNVSDAVRNIISYNHVDSPTKTGNVPDHIYPFPLIIKESPVHGGVKRERIAPIDLSRDVSFPELDLVSNFMDTFGDQRNAQNLYDARRNQDDDGTFLWIPVSPLDSILGGASPESPYLNMNNNVRSELTTTLMERFYVLTQGSIYNTFYGTDSTKIDLTKRKAYIDLYANSEAINIVTTLSANKQNAQTIQLMADQYKGNIPEFYDYVKTLSIKYNDGTSSGKTGNLYNFPTDGPKSFVVTPSQPFEGQAYVDKNNPNFSGVYWWTNNVVLQGTPDEEKLTESSDKPIENFNANAKTKWFQRGIAEELLYDFTQENVIFLKDIDFDDGKASHQQINGVNLFTRYLTNTGDQYRQIDAHYVTSDIIPNPKFPGTSTDITERAIQGQQIAYAEGNQSFNVEDDYIKEKKALRYGDNILDTWISALQHNDIINTLTGNTNMSTILMLSNFGTTASPFNRYPNALNTLIFDTPAAVQVPDFYGPYLGGLLTAIDDGWVDEILEFFTGTTGDNGTGATLVNKGFYILADLHDVQTYLSEKDKATFKEAYNNFANTNDTHGTLVEGVISLVDYCRQHTGNKKESKDYWWAFETRGYQYLLNRQSNDVGGNATGHGDWFWIIETLATRKTLVNFSQITFEMDTIYPEGYKSIEALENPATNSNYELARTANENFFNQFFIRLGAEVALKMKNLKEEEKALKKIKGDNDIINQLYYSFKNINDKWVTGSKNNKGEYPFNREGGNRKLIDSFAFVDRGMNPIGETVINAEILVDMFNDPNISLFSVISQLLSLNNFVFFPLQNFMNFSGSTAWEDSFRIQTGAIKANNSTAFVCMYIGGTSSYPSVAGNGFENDGIIDIAEPGVDDYFTKKPQNQGTVNDTQEEKNGEFPWRQVRAFRVRFGEQNQSMFTDVKIDSKEYPETNESIQILSRLAGDNNPDAPVPKGQNLYNLYENRSYKATVSGFGNAMIQPTQYFQLENIPLFNGAYIILTVEHNITANKMTTSFSGTKLLKYPVPRVLNPMAFTNYNPNASPGDLTKQAAALSSRLETHYNAMYDGTDNSLKIE